MSDRKIVLGIGNPGKQYENTRHNLGFMVVDRLAQRYGAGLNNRKWNAIYGEAMVDGCKVLLVQPQTFVNASGPVLRQIMDFYKIELADTLVIVDDLHLKFGDIRLRVGGSHGGHNGLRDIERHCTREYPRIRMGIGKPKSAGAEQVGHVLGGFHPDEKVDMDKFLNKASDCTHAWITNGVKAAMNFNGPLNPPPPRPKPPPENHQQSHNQNQSPKKRIQQPANPYCRAD